MHPGGEVDALFGAAFTEAPFIMRVLLCFIFWGGVIAGGWAAEAGGYRDDPLVKEALAAEARLESEGALRLFLQAAEKYPERAFLLQKIAKQYSDSVVDVTEVEEKRRRARRALEYAERAYALEPGRAENVLSLAVSRGALAVFSDTRTKIEYSRLIKEEATQALGLEPDYDWAHHVLGRWHYEIASLGRGTRFLVRVIYGGFPPASHEEAIKHLERAVALAPEVAPHHLELGFARLAAGQREAAREAFARGLALPSRAKHDEEAKARAREALETLRRG